MNYYIVTGASRGLGEAIVNEINDQNCKIICLSRTMNTNLEKVAAEKQIPLSFIECDLSDIQQLSEIIDQLLSMMDIGHAQKITLINNAGTVNPIKGAGNAKQEELILHVHLNLLTPILISEALIRETKGTSANVVIVNITSGAANRPVPGWSAYCSTKAGLNMYTKTVGVEQEEKRTNITSIAFSPGIMDTDMQGTIRKATKDEFSSLNQFEEYHEKGLLRSPSFVAKALMNLLSGPLENGRVYDIKEFL
ncbi:(S)-benzoin forming benzil reductase [Metabacillus halosaccharovorans]|uniref:(S)-benzoin forming benzil reductase n=1 Tax=Metabacillus halosaccharovorans TaxID=930124 RepID=UPI000995BBF2|nr:(S)-benzoin forming benzil reductase [Metabacillus halosaccharovorans]